MAQKSLNILIQEVGLTQAEKNEIGKEADLTAEAHARIIAGDMDEAIDKLEQLKDRHDTVKATANKVWKLLTLLKKDKENPITRVNPWLFSKIYMQEMKTKTYVRRIRLEIIRAISVAKKLNSNYFKIRVYEKQARVFKGHGPKFADRYKHVLNRLKMEKQETAPMSKELATRVINLQNHLTNLFRMEQAITKLLRQEMLAVSEKAGRLSLVKAVRPIPKTR